MNFHCFHVVHLILLSLHKKIINKIDPWSGFRLTVERNFSILLALNSFLPLMDQNIRITGIHNRHAFSA